jgi:hypothetical protein
MTLRRARLFGTVVLPTLLLAFSCSLLPREEAGTVMDGVIRLRIQAPAASKGITVSEFDVAGMNIQVLDPGGLPLASIDWAKSEGSTSYEVPVKQLGQHRIEVTHFGERDGEQAQATESAAFEIRAMKITVIDILPGCIGMIRIPDLLGPEDGTITGRVIGAGDHNGYNFQVVVLPAGAELVEENILGVWEEMIVNGTVSVLVRELPDFSDPLLLVGGELYDVYGFIDLDGDENPSAGDYLGSKMGIEVDGDTFVEFTYPADFAQVPESPGDWRLYGTWANVEYNGMHGPAAQIIIYESGIVELYENVGDLIPFETFPFQITNEWTDEQSRWFEAIVYESTVMLFRIYQGGNTLEVVTSEVIYYRQ